MVAGPSRSRKPLNRVLILCADASALPQPFTENDRDHENDIAEESGDNYET